MIRSFYPRGDVTADRQPNRWILLIHQLPPKPAYLRVKIWRRLQGIGAVAIKNSVYVLPDTDAAREDFAWVLREIRQHGGAEASLCEARLVDGLTDEQLQRSFVNAREADYRDLARDVRSLVREMLPRRGAAIRAQQRAPIESGLVRLRKRLAEIGDIDFFGAPGRETVEGLLADVERRLAPAAPASAPTSIERRIEDVRGRVWVTRTGVHVDRMACAWLIRRFIDPAARFKFVPGRGYRPEPGELRFDMFEAEFTHRGELCTFEVLLGDFALRDGALRAIAQIVHDIDLKDATFARAETAGIEHLIAGIAWSNADDEERVARASTLLDALYAWFGKKSA